MRGILIVVGVLVTFAFAVPSFVVADVGNNYTLCKLQKEVRTLRMDKDAKDGRCQAVYTKNGKDKIEGEAINPTSCEDVLTRIRGTLEGAGWKCRNVKNSTISSVGDGVE